MACTLKSSAPIAHRTNAVNSVNPLAEKNLLKQRECKERSLEINNLNKDL